ncbi:MAG: hypothetical protein ACKOI2_01215 [Actinomycetota bacterium]
MDATSTQDIDSLDLPDQPIVAMSIARQLLACAIAGGKVSQEGIHRFAGSIELVPVVH